MKIIKLKIENFRGINRLEWALPDEKIFCLIGKGDSTKTTVLEAIRCAFSPQWNHAFNDSDFYQCNTDNLIQIEIVIGDLLPEFCAEQKYGAHLRGWKKDKFKLNDEPDDNDEPVLSIRLTVSKDLEPKWKVITDRNPDGVDFKATDRAKAGVGLIGAYSEKQLTWTAGTSLAKITESDNLNESLVEATRAARDSLDDKGCSDLFPVCGIIATSPRKHIPDEAAFVRVVEFRRQEEADPPREVPWRDGQGGAVGGATGAD